MEVYILYDSDTCVTRETDPTDEWSGEDRVTTWNVEDVSLTKPRNSDYKSLEISYDVDTNKRHYLVYGIYSTGDSFSHHADSNIEFVDLYRTREEAEQCVSLLEKNQSGINPFLITTSAGYHLNYNPPWGGYFEVLSYIKIMPVLL